MRHKATIAVAAGAMVLLAGCTSSARPAVSSPPTTSLGASPSTSLKPSTPTNLALMTGPQLAAAAAKAMLAAGSFKATATGSMLGGTPSPFTLVMSAQASATHLSFHGKPATIIMTKTATYLNGPVEMWTSQKVPAALAKKLAGKWVVVPSGNGPGGLTLAAMAKELAAPTSGGKILDAVTKSTYKGKAVYVVKQADGSLIDIAAVGAPLPVYVENHGADQSTYVLYDYGKPNVITIPKGALDIATLAK